jgi:transposase InsO family protein
MDIFEHESKNYLVAVDHYSDHFEVDELEDMTAKTIIRTCKKNFARYGVPKIVHSDNARNFVNDEFKKFATSWDFKMATSSPYYSQGNGKAESAVKMAKVLIKKANESKQDIYKCLLMWRNTPNDIGSSPNQRLIGRRTRCDIPMTVLRALTLQIKK